MSAPHCSKLASDHIEGRVKQCLVRCQQEAFFKRGMEEIPLLTPQMEKLGGLRVTSVKARAREKLRIVSSGIESGGHLSHERVCITEINHYNLMQP